MKFLKDMMKLPFGVVQNSILRRLLSGILVLSISGYSELQAQSIFDFPSSKKYAAYLIESSRFVEGAAEYERMLEQFPGNDSLKWNAGAAWYRAGKPEKALKIVTGMAPKTPFQAAMLMIWKMELGDPLKTDSLMERFAGFPMSFRSDAANLSRFTDARMRHKHHYKDSLGQPDLSFLAHQVNQFHWKKPAKAALMSALIPGLGKVYTKDYKDAVVSFMYVSLSAFQVYRGLDKKNGHWAPYSIIFAGVGGIFYLGNIYGAYQSAKRYNRNATKEFRQKALKNFSGTWVIY